MSELAKQAKRKLQQVRFIIVAFDLKYSHYENAHIEFSEAVKVEKFQLKIFAVFLVF